MRNPRYRHEAPTTKREFQIPESGDPYRQLQLQCYPAVQSAASLSPVIWGSFDTDIRWGGQPRAGWDELLPPPDWTIAEPGWHPRPAQRPDGSRVHPKSPELPGQSAWIKW